MRLSRFWTIVQEPHSKKISITRTVSLLWNIAVLLTWCFVTIFMAVHAHTLAMPDVPSGVITLVLGLSTASVAHRFIEGKENTATPVTTEPPPTPK